MKKILTTTILAAVLSLEMHAQTYFTPGRLAVLRIGDGVPDTGGTNQGSDWNNKQNPIYIDEFDPSVANATVPTASVAVPRTGHDALFMNGNAGSESEGCTRSLDRSVITTTGYNGDILATPGTPSNLPIPRGILTVDAFGTNKVVLSRNDWYGFATGKTNPRGVVSDDGVDQFWGSGNVVGTLYYSPSVNDGVPAFLQNVSDTRSIKIINGTVYTSIIGKDSKSSSYPAGIYNFVDFSGNPDPLPSGFVGFHLVVPCVSPYTNIVGFYVNPTETVAYTADLTWGIQKYVKAGASWKLACNYNVQGYEQTSTGFVITNDVKNSFGGCWDVVADFSGTNPVLYASTADFSMYNGNINSNRVVRIVDTNASVTGLTITNFTVVAQAKGTNVAFRALDFTPDLRPLVTSISDDQSVVVGSSASFTVTATASATALIKGPITYQWLKNGTTVLGGQTSSTLSFTPVLGDDGSTYQCAVSDFYGSVTSTPACNLSVTTVAVAPFNKGTLQHLTNAVGDIISITAKAGGTTPLTYQWYQGANLISDMNEFTGTGTKTLVISDAQIGVDDTNYFCLVSNGAGSSNIFAATLNLFVAPPLIASQPGSTTVLSNSPAVFSGLGFGTGLNYQWYTNGAPVNGANDVNLTIDPSTVSIASIKLVITNLGGAVTSAPVSLTVLPVPPHSFVNYTNPAQIYFQSFDSLPVVTNNTVNTGNPVQIYQVGSAGAPVTYSIDNPFDYAYPIVGTGGVGGLGLTNKMDGWYGWGSVSSKLGAHQGDQSTGGNIDYGTLSAVNFNQGETNRALGVQSTSTTGSSAFGLKLVNNTSTNLHYITLSFIGELWRNQPVSNTIVFSYYIDANTNDAFSATNPAATFVPALNVSFQTNAAGELTVDGSQPGNQINIGVTNFAIGQWTTNTALWLVWGQTNSNGGAQGLAIDSLKFSATNSLSIGTPILTGTVFRGAGGNGNPGLSFSFANTPGLAANFTIWSTTNLMLPFNQWQNMGNPTEVGSGVYQFIDAQATNNPQEFYRVTSP